MRWTFTARQVAKTAVITLLVSSALLAGAASTETQPKHPAARSQKTTRSVHHKKAHRTKLRGQKAIDGDRAREIQVALIREHYFKGQPTGKWDDATQAAMKRYQADQGWQHTTVPDARALIRLGLGPDTGHLLNPESAMTTAPVMAHVANATSGRSSSQSGSMPAGNSMPASSAPVSTSSSPAISGDPAR